jgi:hypothetical protein
LVDPAMLSATLQSSLSALAMVNTPFPGYMGCVSQALDSVPLQKAPMTPKAGGKPVFVTLRSSGPAQLASCAAANAHLWKASRGVSSAGVAGLGYL